MQTVSSVSQLKTIARDDLPGNYSTAILAMLIVEGLYLSLLYLTSPVTGDGPFLAVLSLLMYFLLQLFMGVFASGRGAAIMTVSLRHMRDCIRWDCAMRHSCSRSFPSSRTTAGWMHSSRKRVSICKKIREYALSGGS